MEDGKTVAVENELNTETLALESISSDDNLGIFRQTAAQFQELMMMYSSAIREVRTKLEVLNDEFQVQRSHNPIAYIKYRVKRPESIVEKLKRRGFPVTLQSIEENLHDVAGIRVICNYVQDIYMVADMLTSQSDITVIQVKDYIAEPKPNGYRSLHLVVFVPVFFSNGSKQIKVEIQIRTIAMEFWATLEHQLHYKAEGDVSEDTVKELTDCARVIAETDLRMQAIYNNIYESGNKTEPEDSGNA